MPKISKGVRGSDKRPRIRHTKVQLASSKRKAQSQMEKSSAVLQAFLGRTGSEKVSEENKQDEAPSEASHSAEDLEKRFTERIVVESRTHGSEDTDSDDDDVDGAGFDESGDYLDDSDELAEEGVMFVYLSAIQNRLKDEIRSRITKNDVQIPDEKKWLVTMMKEHQFVIPWRLAPTVCSKLGITCSEPAYYCTVHVWLPDLQFKQLPFCGVCKSNDDVSRHGFDPKYPARRVTGLKKDEFILTARYICRNCKDDKQPHTFRGYSPESLNLMLCRRKLLFPAMLTHKSGVTMELAHLIRSLVAAGVRPNGIAAMIAEMHHREHHEQMLLAESGRLASIAFQIATKLFSEFDDRNGYNGRRITGKYIQNIYIKLMQSLRKQIDADTKKRDLDVLKIDASYKLTKRLSRIGGEKLFDGLITVKNDCQEIRSQFVIYGESHDQIRPPLEAMKATMDSNGQTGPRLAFTDNPRRDTEMLLSTFDSLAKTQETYNTIAEEENKQRTIHCAPTDLLESAWQRLQQPQLPPCSVSNYKYTVLRTSDEITFFAGTALDLMKERTADKKIIALDLEWPVYFNNHGRVRGTGRVATIQLAYHTFTGDLDNDILTAVIVMRDGAQLPPVLMQLLREKSIKFVGVRIGGDIAKLKRDFIAMRDVSINYIELGTMAMCRGVVPRNSSYTLVALVEDQLKESMEKEQRLSDWSGKLRTEQLEYAALDAIKSLEVYDRLERLPDLTLELPRSNIIAGTKVDIVASMGKIPDLATLCAEGEIVSQNQSWTIPTGFSLENGQTVPGGRNVLVRITKVIGPGLIMKGYKTAGKKNASLRDFVNKLGDGDFVILVNLAQLRHQYEQRRTSLSGIIEKAAGTIQTSHEGEIRENLTATTDTAPTDSTLDADDLLVHDDIFQTNDENPATTMIDNIMIDVDDADDNDSDDPVSYAELAPAAIREINNIIEHALDKAGSPFSQPTDAKLDAPPASLIPIKYSAVLGDILHAIMRMRVSTKHECRKAYSAAIVRAFLEWDPERLREVKAALLDLGVKEKEIEARLYYNMQWFAARVERRALPSNLLYWRVRAVLAYFGPKIDSVSKKPLFGKNEWRKANNLLSEILKGYYSDPPGFSFYRYRVDCRGRIVRDRKGFALLSCSRGTNDVENEHKNLLAPIGNSKVGIEMMDCLLADWRVRRNMKSSRKNRPNFPNFWHFDPWIVDALQITVEQGRGMLLYPNWTNSSDLAETPERHGFVPLPNTKLTDAINERAAILEKERDTQIVLSKDMKYVAKCIGTKLPYQPFSTSEEFRLYPKLRLTVTQNGSLNPKDPKFEVEMCFAIIPHVDAVRIFPKTPVYIRQMEKRYLERKRIGAAVEAMSSTLDALTELNNVTAKVAIDSALTSYASQGGGIVANVRKLCPPPLLPKQNFGVLGGRMLQQLGAVIAANVIIRESGQVESRQPMKRTRSKDKIPRRKRHCKTCQRPQNECPAAGSSKSRKMECTFIAK